MDVWKIKKVGLKVRKHAGVVMQSPLARVSCRDVVKARLVSVSFFDFFSSDVFLSFWLGFRGIPRREGCTWQETFFSCAWLFLLPTFEHFPRLDPNNSVLRSAHHRINSGHVLHVKRSARSGPATITVSLMSSMSKSKHYCVEGSFDKSGKWTLSDSCVNRELPLVGDACAHLTAFSVLFDRIDRGFEQVVFSEEAVALFPGVSLEFAKLASNVDKLAERLDAERTIVRAAAKRQKLENPVLFRESKYFFLRHVARVRSLQLVYRPIPVRPRKVPPSILVDHRQKREMWMRKVSKVRSDERKEPRNISGHGNQPTLMRQHDTRSRKQANQE